MNEELFTPIDWSAVNGFSKAEFQPTKDGGGDPLDKKSLEIIAPSWDMHPDFIKKKVELRRKANDIAKTRMIVSANGGFCYSGHSKNSLHYGLKKGQSFNDIDLYESLAEKSAVTLGRASDFHYETKAGECWPWPQAAIFTYMDIDSRFGLGFYPHSNTGVVHLDYRRAVPYASPSVWWRDKAGGYHFYPFAQFHLAMIEALQESKFEAKGGQ